MINLKKDDEHEKQVDADPFSFPKMKNKLMPTTLDTHKESPMKPFNSLSFASLLFSSALILLPSSVTAQSWVPSFRDGIGKDKPLCHALVKRIESFLPPNSPDTRCSTWDMIASYPEFTEPPWKELDPNEHKDLLFQMIKSEFSENPNPTEEERQKRDAEFHKRVDAFIKEGGQMRVWRSRPGIIYEKGSLPPEEQVFVQKGIGPEHSSFCVGTPFPNWSGGIHIALPDLSGLSPLDFIKWKSHAGTFIDTSDFDKAGKIKDPLNDALMLLRTNALLIYKGNPFLISGQDVWQLPASSLQHVCSIK